MNHANKKGFTLIELMLSMGFVAFLLIAIAATVIQIGNIYNRGLILKEINQVGRSIDDELKRSISKSAPFIVDQADPDTKYIVIGSNAGGRLCLGQYSYIWNYGNYIQSGLDTRNRYTDGGSDIRFVKISDPGASYCGAKKAQNIDNSPTSLKKPVELLNPGQSNLAIQSFSITSSAIDSKTKQQLYNIVFLIGTNNQQALKDNASCKPPNESGSDLNFCAINEFKLTVRAGGE